MFCFLLAYWSTAHSTTGRAPAELLFRRSIRCKLPALSGLPSPTANQLVRDKDAENKQVTADYGNERRRASDQEAVKIGDTVLLERSTKTNKLDSTYLPEPHQIVDGNGDQVVVKSPTGVHIRRNIGATKPFQPTPQPNSPPEPMQLAAEPATNTRPQYAHSTPAWLNNYVTD